MRKAGDIVSSMFSEGFESGFMETARSTADMFSSWDKIVAELWPAGGVDGKEDVQTASMHSNIRNLERGLLLVEADHPGWIQILQTRQAELLSSVQRRYPELGIKGIAFRLSRGEMPALR